MIQRNINAYSPAAATTLTLQQVSVQIGSGGAVAPYEESFLYNPVAMATGILLSYNIAPGTYPQVFLNGLRLITRPDGEHEGGDVAFSTALGGQSSLVFVGDIYVPASGDIVLVSYWFPA